MRYFFGVVVLSVLILFGGVVPVDAVNPNIAAPSLVSPADGGQAIIPVTLQWSQATFPGGLAGGYIVEIIGLNAEDPNDIESNDNATIQKILLAEWSFTNSLSLDPIIQEQPIKFLFPGMEYRWRVRACLGFDIPANIDQACGPWSNGDVFWKFKSALPPLAKPVLVSPENTIYKSAPLNIAGYVGAITLEWNAVPEATIYKVILQKITTYFSSPLTFETLGVPDTPGISSYSIPSQYINVNTAYKWKVIPFRLKPYEYSIGGIKITFTDTTQGPDSDEWQFFVTLPIVSPTNFSGIVTLIPAPGAAVPYKLTAMQWEKVPLASAYRIEFLDENGKQLLFPDGKTLVPSKNLTDNLLMPYDFSFGQTTVTSDIPFNVFPNAIGRTFKWQVTACEYVSKIGGGISLPNCGPTGGPWAFTMVYDKPTITSPTEGQEMNSTTLSLAWGRPLSPSTDPIKYSLKIYRGAQLELSKEKDSVEQSVTESIDIKTLEPGSYTLKVRACTPLDKGCSDWSDDRQFIIPDTIAPRVDLFDVKPKASEGKWVNAMDPKAVTISWTVSDTGGSHLKQVEVWRASFDDDKTDNKLCNDTDKTGCNWGEKALKIVPAPTDLQDPDQWQGSTTDTPDNGTYWYGIHVIDKAVPENWITETKAGFKPIKVQVDKTSPTVTNVTSTAADKSYTVGASIPVTITFSESVTVTGTPRLTLETGATDVVVNYSSGSPGTTLTFQYTVAVGHNSADLDYVDTNALALNGGTINDAAGNPAKLTLPDPASTNSLGESKNIVIDTTIASMPTCTPSKTFTISVEVNCSGENGATLRYTTDGADPTSSSLTYTSSLAFTKTTTLKVAVWDAAGNRSNIATFEYTLAPNKSPTAQPDSVTTQEDTTFSIDLSDKIGDPDGDPLTLSISSGPSNGTAAVDNKKVTYKPRDNFNGSDSFQYTISDDRGGTATATVKIIVSSLNDPPIAVDDTAEIQQFQRSIPIDVLDNDSDPENNTLVVNRFGELPKNGTVQKSQNNKAVIYTPKDSGSMQIGTVDTFEYWIDDGNGGEAKAKVTITVISSGTPGGCAKYCVTLDQKDLPAGTATCICNPLTTTKFTDVVDRILNILFFIALAVAPVMIIVAGFKFLTGGGNPETLIGARQMLIWTGIGFGIILLSKGIVLLVRKIIGF